MKAKNGQKVKTIDYKGNTKIVWIFDERTFNSESPLFEAWDEYGNVILARKLNCEIIGEE